MLPISKIKKGNMDSSKREDIEVLRGWLKKQPHLPSLPDEQLLLFLHSCYYSIEHAKQAIDVCFTVRTHAPEIFDDRNPNTSNVLAAMDIVEICKLPKRDKKEQIVLLIRLKDSDVTKFSFDSIAKAAMLCFELLIREYPMAPGYVILVDVTGSSISHVAKININSLKNILIYVQEGFPLRMRAVHFINVSPVLDKLLMLMKPFLSEELSNMFFFHKGDNEDLYKEYDRNFMPKDYGGKEESTSDLCADMKNMVKNDITYIEEEAKWRVDESKRTGKLKTRVDLFGVEGSFKKLCID